MPELWVMGAAGGAGDSTGAALAYSGQEAGHVWPAPFFDLRRRVLLCARTNMSGMKAASRRIGEWATGGAQVDLVGLVLIDDAPGRLPKPLRDQLSITSSALANVWRIGWNQDWRAGVLSRPADAEKLIETVTALGARNDKEKK